MYKKTAVLKDKDLYILIKNILGENVYFYEYEVPKKDINSMIENEIKIVVFDGGINEKINKQTNEQTKEQINEQINRLEELKLNKFIIIYCDLKINSKDLKIFLEKELINDFFEKMNYEEIVNIMDKINSKIKAERIILKNKNLNQVIVNIDDICCVNYDRENRKCIVISDNEIMYSKKKFQEMEEILCANKNIIKADRGTIINIDKIHEISTEGAYIILKNGKKIDQSVSGIKEIKEKLRDKLSVIEFD